MLRQLGLAGAVLGTVLSLALPVSGLAMERNGRNNSQSGYSWTDGARAYATPTNRIRFDQHSRREVRSDREGQSHNGWSDSQIRHTPQNADRNSDNHGLRDFGAFGRR
jgi:hypothetical protein